MHSKHILKMKRFHDYVHNKSRCGNTSCRGGGGAPWIYIGAFSNKRLCFHSLRRRLFFFLTLTYISLLMRRGPYCHTANLRQHTCICFGFGWFSSESSGVLCFLALNRTHLALNEKLQALSSSTKWLTRPLDWVKTWKELHDDAAIHQWRFTAALLWRSTSSGCRSLLQRLRREQVTSSSHKHRQRPTTSHTDFIVASHPSVRVSGLREDARDSHQTASGPEVST